MVGKNVNVKSISVSALIESERLDAEYHLSPGVMARRRIMEYGHGEGVAVPLGQLARIRQPGRFRRLYAAAAEVPVPYLRPYDLFDYFPRAADQLSPRSAKLISSLRVREGELLIPASGRNLGPAIRVDGYLSRFAVSHDAIRVDIDDEADQYYVMAFLNSRVGQSVIRADISGSVIDHVTEANLAAIPVPSLAPAARESIQVLARTAARLRGAARIKLNDLANRLNEQLDNFGVDSRLGWTARAGDLTDRFDAAASEPKAHSARRHLQERGGVTIGEASIVHKPSSRYKAFHVAASYGRPFLTGNQLLQDRVIAPKYMAERVFDEPERYEVQAWQVVFGADGRANEGLAQPALITLDREGWLASEHVMRLSASTPAQAGWIYLSLLSKPVQLQIQALPRGSVVDTLYADDVRNVFLPPFDEVAGQEAAECWTAFSIARSLEDRASAAFDAVLGETSLAASPSLLLTAAETAAVLGVSTARLLTLSEQGKLEPLSRFDVGTLYALDDVLLAADKDLNEGAASSRTARTALSCRVGPSEGELVLVDVELPSGVIVALNFPATLLSSSRIRRHVGEKFLWRVPRELLEEGGETQVSLVETSFDRPEIPVVTNAQWASALRNADDFIRQFVISDEARPSGDGD
jgi:hypothetical protein